MAHRAQQHSIGAAASVERGGGKVMAGALIAQGAAGVFGEVESEPTGGAQHLDGLGRDINADAVARQNGDGVR
jgi:hypothetical protein